MVDMLKAMQGRDHSLDIAKGVAIIAIVFGHVWRGLGLAGLIDLDGALFASVDATVYMFHLAVFAFTAGLFVERGMMRDMAWAYTARRDLAFLWLYVLWTFIQGVTKIAFAGDVNTNVSWVDVVQLWRPLSPYWFFGWIALMLIAAAAFQPWLGRARTVGLASLAVAVSLAAWGLNGEYIGTQGLGLTVFFVVGLIIGGGNLLRWLKQPAVTLAAVALVGVVTLIALAWPGHATPPTTDGAERTALSVALGVVASTSGVVAVLALSPLLQRIPGAGRALAFCGLRSLDVFVAHVIFLAGIRVVLVRLGIDSLVVHVLIGTTGAVVGSLALGWLARKVRCAWLFESPAWFAPRSRTTVHAQ